MVFWRIDTSRCSVIAFLCLLKNDRFLMYYMARPNATLHFWVRWNYSRVMSDPLVTISKQTRVCRSMTTATNHISLAWVAVEGQL